MEIFIKKRSFSTRMTRSITWIRLIHAHRAPKKAQRPAQYNIVNLGVCFIIKNQLKMV